ncbi:MAG: AAA family ATPase, partial [Bacteroidetes bacterium]|nr:AAA family ATPase [Bacteroidota bacterium]
IELRKNRQLLCNTSTELKKTEEKLATLPNLEYMIERFREAGLEEKLKEQSLLLTEQQILDSIPEHLQSFFDACDCIDQELPIDRTFLSEKALNELPGKTIISSANDILIELENDLMKISRELKAALNHANVQLNEIQDQWNSRKQQVMDAYEKILRNLHQSHVDGEEYMSLRRKIESLRPLSERQEVLKNIEQEGLANRRSLLAEWEDLKAMEFRALDLAAKKVNEELKNRIKVKVQLNNDLEPLFELLRTQIGGRLNEAINSIRNSLDFSLTEFVAACRAGTEQLQSIYGITSAQSQRIVDADPNIFMEIEELSLNPTTKIQLNLSLNSKKKVWQNLEELSTGQKATAVLLLLLLESDAPLIIDQPEDDLDNRFITEGVIPRIRNQKQTRQFIFSTHNANIPVLGDAEMIIGLVASGEAFSGRSNIADQHMGSIDNKPIRELVEEILEGGKEAFEIRRKKYGF